METGKTTVNESNPLWVCSNAFNLQHNCVFCICSSCKYSVLSNRPKRAKCNTCDSNTENAMLCNHTWTDLKEFTDKTYFEATFISEAIADKRPIPTKCAQCHCILTNKKM